jgi:serine/threonine-protein kinase
MSQQITIPGPGDTLAERYLILDELGRGSYGVVFKAQDQENGRVVAIKTLLPQSILDREVIDRFTREAQLVSRIDHENVISLYDYGQRDNLFYMVVEYVEGRSLTQLIEQDAPLSPEDAEHYASQILGALEHAHTQGIVHRDLKPENILLQQPSSPDGKETVKILDFGIAKLMRGEGDEFKTLTQAGHVLGTPHYMSPEQISGDEVTAHADLYSVGIILFELLAGKHPFEGTTSTAVMVAHLRDDPPPLPGMLEHSKWGEAVREALKKQPYERLASARAFLDIISREENLEEVTRVFEPELHGREASAGAHLQEKTQIYQPGGVPRLGPGPNMRPPESYAPKSPPMPSFGAEPALAGADMLYPPVDRSGEMTQQWSKENGDGSFEQIQALRDNNALNFDASIASHIPSLDETSQPMSAPEPMVIPEKKRSLAPLLIGVGLMLLLFIGLVSYVMLGEQQSTDVQASQLPNNTDTPQKQPTETSLVANTAPSSETSVAGTTPNAETTPEEENNTSETSPAANESAPIEDPPEVDEKEKESSPSNKSNKRKRDNKKPKKSDPEKSALVKIRIVSKPKKASVYLGDELLGKTPYTLELSKGSSKGIRVESIGYHASYKKVSGSRDGTVTFELKPKSLLSAP